MCAIYGFLDYGKKIPHKLLTKIVKELSIAAECRGTDATGISYVNDGKIVTFKKAKPAHKVKLFFPKDTTALIGHNRMTTQGNEKFNYNNHPFEGKTSQHNFALAHNGVLYNDREIRTKQKLPETVVETDSYIAVQLIEKSDSVDSDSLKNAAEAVYGSFVFTVLRDDNTLFLVKGSNPITLYHFAEYGLYIYASTKEILDRALKLVNFKSIGESVVIKTGDIIQISANGKISSSTFDEIQSAYDHHNWFDWYNYGNKICDDVESDLLYICGFYGVEREDVELLLEYGYSSDDIEEMLFDEDYFNETISAVKALHNQCKL